MTIVTGTIIRCGKPRPNGRGLCQFPLRGGKCPTHDCDLHSRNSRVAQNFQTNRPDATHAQRSKAGRAGYDKVGGLVWWAEQTDKARQWRLEHPSAHERVVIELLLQTLAIDVNYDREVVLEGDPRAVDFVLYRGERAVCAIEVTQSATHATFGRDEKLKAKVAWLESLDLPVHLFYGGDDLQTEIERLGKFLHAHQLTD